MGYTHYWGNVDDPAFEDAWPQMVDDAGLIVAAVIESGVRLAGPNGTGRPLVSELGIWLNGDDALGQAYETFVVDPPADSGEHRWRFCKTEHHPYDLAVCAILLRCHLLLPESFRINSDGSWDAHWSRARQVVTTLFGPIPTGSPFGPTI